MIKVALEGMKFWGYHGVYQEEKIIGNHFLIDTYLQAKVPDTYIHDLDLSINYEKVYAVVKETMDQPEELLENIGFKIISGLKSEFQHLAHLKIRISKLNPPLGGEVNRSFIELEKSFITTCPKTQEKFSCYNDQHCWCQKIEVEDVLLKDLEEKYGEKCLSAKGLKAFIAEQKLP